MITLNLTEKQAKVLRTICGRIGGPPNGLRGEMDAIANMLDQHSEDFHDRNVEESMHTLKNAIYFTH
jgi:hypothetical protein